MELIQPPRLEEESPCPYLPGEVKCLEYFLAHRVSAEELTGKLSEGWRKFGPCYFRPSCPECRLCIPLRVDAGAFSPSRSQRRVLRRNDDLTVSFAPLRPSPRIFEIYRAHSLERFGQESEAEEFLLNFYASSCPGLQTEIRLGDKLIAAGFLDRGSNCLSSVYFAFDPAFSGRSLGILGALQEIALARRLGLRHYYLGYYVPGCPSMAYKDTFLPREHYAWISRRREPPAPRP